MRISYPRKGWFCWGVVSHLPSTRIRGSTPNPNNTNPKPPICGYLKFPNTLCPAKHATAPGRFVGRNTGAVTQPTFCPWVSNSQNERHQPPASGPKLLTCPGWDLDIKGDHLLGPPKMVKTGFLVSLRSVLKWSESGLSGLRALACSRYLAKWEGWPSPQPQPTDSPTPRMRKKNLARRAVFPILSGGPNKKESRDFLSFATQNVQLGVELHKKWGKPRSFEVPNHEKLEFLLICASHSPYSFPLGANGH